jgi:2',3'-cyclic-nucleotide 2'-phosphodiesterase (5'-nucleotidase family)
MPFLFSDFLKRNSLYFFLLLLAACSAPAKLIKQESVLINVNANDSTKEDAAVKQLIEPYKQDLDKEMSEVLIISETVFEKAQPEGALGNLVADIVLEKANELYRPDDFKYADFCLLNNGGLRVSLPQGEITRGKIFELMPFENEIVIVTLSGEKVAELIQYIIAIGGQPVSGLQLKNFNQPNMQALIKGVSFDKNKTYKVATSDYLSSGGDKMDFFKTPIKIETTGYKIRDAIIDYLIIEKQKGNSLKPHYGGRLTNEQ